MNGALNVIVASSTFTLCS